MVYLFLYNRSYGDTGEVRERLNSLEVIDEIRELFPYSFFLSSDVDANTISAEIRRLFPDRRFMITEIGNNRQGWMPRRFWNFIRDNEDR